VHKSFRKFVKEDSKYTTQGPMIGCQIHGCQWVFF